MITIRDIQFAYPNGEFLLAIPAFYVKPGEKVAVIGPSGSGKTTLLSLVSGILTPRRGTVRVADVEVNRIRDSRRRAFRIREVGSVFQDSELIDYLNVIDNILHPYRISDTLCLNTAVRERARSIASRMGIGDKLKRHPSELSQGEKQRVAICRALLPESHLLLADEPTGNLDPHNKGLIVDLLFDCVDAQGASLLAVTHDYELLPRFDRVVNLADYCAAGAA